MDVEVNMDPIILSLIGIIGLIVVLLLGVHIGPGLFLCGLAGVMACVGFEAGCRMAIHAFYHKISAPALITLPLFILMGYLASGGGISDNVYDSLNMWLGKFKEGLGISTIAANVAFATVCGSSLVSTAVFSKISAPQMIRFGYDKRLAYGICASAGAIGMLIPPSVLAIIYGMLSGVSMGKILMATVVPGLILAVAFSGVVLIVPRVMPSAIPDRVIRSVTWREKIMSLTSWWSTVVVVVVLFGGMYGGVFSPSEAGAVAAVVLGAIYLIHNLPNPKRRGLLVKNLLKSLKETASTAGMIFIIYGSSTIFSNFMVLTGFTDKIGKMFIGTELPPMVVMLLFVVIYLILGCFLDGISIFCITIPVFNPIIDGLGINPVYYASVAILSIECGFITPPVGLNLYAAKGVAPSDVSLEDIIVGSAPFFVAMVIVLVITIAFPALSTFLPAHVR